MTSEVRRLAALAKMQLLDTAPEREFDIIVETARRQFGCKIALVSLIDADRQWFKARCGLTAEETPREQAFCAYAVEADRTLVIPDATADERFRANPLVTGFPHIRFYAGAPIHVTDGEDRDHRRWPIGTLCIIDDVPREFSAEQVSALEDLVLLVEALLDARASAIEAIKLAEERQAVLESLDRAHRQFRQAERMANIGSWRLTLADMQTEWSDQTYAIHGLPVGSGRQLERALDFYPEKDRSRVAAAIEHTIESGAPFDFETDFTTAQGEWRRVRSMGELELRDGVPIALIGVFQDITTRYLLEQALRETADTDELTRVASRSRFNRFLDEKIARCTDSGDPMALLLIDLDNFKMVNDQCGHREGDDLLLWTASRLKAPYLQGSFAARIGGDEFVLLIDAPDMLAQLPALVACLLADLRHTVRSGGHAIDASATIGIGILGNSVQTRRELINDADVALYKAKRARRGTAAMSGRDSLILPSDQAATPVLRLVG